LLLYLEQHHTFELGLAFRVVAYPLPLFHAAGFRRKHKFNFWYLVLIVKLSLYLLLVIRKVLLLRYFNYSAEIFKQQTGIDVFQT
jgi:hypothetical protein